MTVEDQPETLAAFAGRLGVKPQYVRELKMAGRLVLADDKHVLPAASIERIRATREQPAAKPAPPAELSFSDFAAFMQCKPGYVTQLRQTGRLVLTDDGKRVRVAESLQLIADSRDPAKAGVVARHAQARAAAAAATGGDTPADDGEDVDDGEVGEGGVSAARRRADALAVSAEAAARKALREEQIELGQLLQLDDVVAAVGGALATLRTTLQNLPSSLAPELAATTGEERARVLLGDAIEHALEECARKLNTIGKGEVA